MGLARTYWTRKKERTKDCGPSCVWFHKVAEYESVCLWGSSFIILKQHDKDSKSCDLASGKHGPSPHAKGEKVSEEVMDSVISGLKREVDRTYALNWPVHNRNLRWRVLWDISTRQTLNDSDAVYIVDALKNGELYEKRRAAHLLGKIGKTTNDPKLLEEIVGVLSIALQFYEDTIVAERTLGALGEMGEKAKSAIILVKEFKKYDRFPRVVTATEDALRKISPDEEDDEETPF